MRLVDIDLLLSEMNNEKTKYTSQIDLKQKASKSVIIDKTLKAYRGLIFDIIKDLPTIEVQQWIPIEERLPKENGCYLVSYKNKEIGVFCKCGVNELSENVIAWMELPQPYQKGTQ